MKKCKCIDPCLIPSGMYYLNLKENKYYNYNIEIINNCDVYRIYDNDKFMANFGKMYFEQKFIDIQQDRKLKLNKLNEKEKM